MRSELSLSAGVAVAAGKFKSPWAWKRGNGHGYIFNERSLVTDLLPNGTLARVARRFGWRRSGLRGGIFNGRADFSTTAPIGLRRQQAFADEIFLSAVENIGCRLLKGFVLASAKLRKPGRGRFILRPDFGYTTDGQQKFFTYTNACCERHALENLPQAYYCYGHWNLVNMPFPKARQHREPPPLICGIRRGIFWRLI